MRASPACTVSFFEINRLPITLLGQDRHRQDKSHETRGAHHERCEPTGIAIESSHNLIVWRKRRECSAGRNPDACSALSLTITIWVVFATLGNPAFSVVTLWFLLCSLSGAVPPKPRSHREFPARGGIAPPQPDF